MPNTDPIIAAITHAQQTASLSVLLPAFLDVRNVVTDVAVREWTLFKPLAATFALQFAPLTAFNDPLTFINWLSKHPEFHGQAEYITHITTAIKARADCKQAESARLVVLLDAIAALNNAGLPVL